MHGRWLLVTHQCSVVEGYLNVVQPARRVEGRITSRTVMPKHSNASKWFRHRVDIEVGKEGQNAIGTAEETKRIVYIFQHKDPRWVALVFGFEVHGDA